MSENSEKTMQITSQSDATGDWRRHAGIFWMLALLGAVVYLANLHFYSIAEHPWYDIHSDDVLFVERFMARPGTVAIERNMDLTRVLEAPPRGGEPAELRDYWHGIDHPALQRWVFHYILRWTGRMPESLPEEWDYTQSHDWNVAAGRVAPEQARRMVRVTNAAFMVAAAALIYVAGARAVGPFAGFLCALAFIDPYHLMGHTVAVVWSLGPDCLLWLMMTGMLSLWVYLEDTWAGTLAAGLAAGLATSTKLNGAFLVVVLCAWLLYRRQWQKAMAAGGLALAIFVLLNPVVWSRGTLGIARVLWDFVAWGRIRAPEYAASFAELADRGWLGTRAVILSRPAWLPGWLSLWLWMAITIALLASRRMRRVEIMPLWSATIALGHLMSVPAPEPRYVMPIQAGLLIGIAAAYWTRRPGELFKSLRERLSRRRHL